jgi:UDP-N-acetylglucosamine transferase subunit ALG13
VRQKKRILICPLDWGLGHATRCIPIIEELLKSGDEVYIASSGDALALLKNEFPGLPFFTLTGYRPRYFFGSAILAVVLQFPKFLRAIWIEHAETGSIIQRHGIEAVISDNRYGCWSKRIPSVFITHQVTLQTPFFSGIVNFLHRKIIQNFSACWVPDVAGENSLAGNLTAHRGQKITYIGHLSRFRCLEPESQKYEVLALISGPEPQRTMFETLVRKELMKSGKKAMMVKGIPDSGNKKIHGELDEISHLGAREMNRAIVESRIIISRPGYSTIMDLAKLGKRAVFVPTPGQTEQEYLGMRLMKNEIALSVPQHKFDLSAALRDEVHFRGFNLGLENTLLKTALTTLLL